MIYLRIFGSVAELQKRRTGPVLSRAKGSRIGLGLRTSDMKKKGWTVVQKFLMGDLAVTFRENWNCLRHIRLAWKNKKEVGMARKNLGIRKGKML